MPEITIEQLRKLTEIVSEIKGDPPDNKGIIDDLTDRDEKIAISCKEAALRIGASENWVREKCKEGEIPSEQIGKRIFIPVRLLEERFNNQPSSIEE